MDIDYRNLAFIWPLVGILILFGQIRYCGGAKNYADIAAGDNFVGGYRISSEADSFEADGVVPNHAVGIIILINAVFAAGMGPIWSMVWLFIPKRK